MIEMVLEERERERENIRNIKKHHMAQITL
jgi:hypothetical protein